MVGRLLHGQFSQNILILDEIFWFFCNFSVRANKELSSPGFLEVLQNHLFRINPSVDLSVVMTLVNISIDSESGCRAVMSSRLPRTLLDAFGTKAMSDEVTQKTLMLFNELFRCDSENLWVH